MPEENAMKKYHVRLTAEQRRQLEHMISAGHVPARQQTHARVLLKADEGEQGPGWTDEQISEALDVSPATIQRVRHRLLEHGLDDALTRRPQPERPEQRKIAGVQEAHLIALSCEPAPAGYQRWSVRLLADRFVVAETGEKVGRETIRRALKKMNSSPG
jgi:transposase